MQLYGKVTDLLSRLGETPETFTGRILFVSMFNDIYCDKTMKKNVRQMLCEEDLVLDNGQLLVQVPRRSGIIWKRTAHKEFGIISEKMLVEFAESRCPIFRATTPLSRGKLKSKGHGKLSIHYCADQATIETIFA